MHTLSIRSTNLRLRDSTNKLEKLIWTAAELGNSVLGLTDHESISAHIKAEKIYKKVKEKYPNFKLIRGNEIYLCRNGLNSDNFIKGMDSYYHFILLAKDSIGHQQIREISTRAWTRSYMARGMRRVPTYYQDLVDIISAHPGHIIGSTACFRKGVMVETKDGWKKIEDIKSGDSVINMYGEWEEVLEPTSRYTEQYGYDIELTGNENHIYCTDNHQFLTITGNRKKPKWVTAESLKVERGSTKDICLLPINYNYINSNKIKKEEFLYSWSKESNYGRKRIILPEEIVITPQLMRLFGLFLGDGCITLKSNPCINFTFNEKEFDNYMNSFISEASAQLNINWSIKRRPREHRVDISCASRELIDLFYWLFGDVKANTKKIPERLRINRNLDIELIFGYFLADGYFRIRSGNSAVKYSTGEYVSASISKQLSYDVYNVLNQLGLSPNLSLSKGRVDKNCVKHQDSWYVEGSNIYLGEINKLNPYTHEQIIDIFNKAIEYKRKDYVVIDNIKYRKIRIKNKTKILMKEQVYCLNNTSHSFKCENVIVHNCLGGALPTQLLKHRETKDEKLLEKIYTWVLQLDSIFGHGNFYLELQPSNNEEQIYVNRSLIHISEKFKIPYIITTDAHYLQKKDRKIHKAYLNAQNGDREVDDFYATTYLMDTEELCSYFNYLQDYELELAFNNIESIKNKCEDYSLLKPLRIPELKWKEVKKPVAVSELMEHYVSYIPELGKFYNSDFDGDKLLAELIVDRIIDDETLNNKETYEAINENLQSTRISSEVNQAHWSSYYLNLQNIIDTCWRAGSLVLPGRGSGVGFILLYILDITQINPLRETTKTFSWRFLNPKRVSVLDVDFDIEGGRRVDVLNAFREEYGQDRVSNVATFGTEKSKSAILTAARGLGIDVDTAQYIASLVPSDRGALRTLSQCMYGDEENGWSPIKQFVFEMTENYPELWEVAKEIEGLVCRMGIHAGGVIFVDEPFTNSTALMRAPDGTIITAYELHDCEDVSLIKYDALSVEAADKIHNCIDLICDYGYAERRGTLKETYESIVGVYNLEREDKKMWEMIWNHEIESLFQMEQQSGIQGIALVKPESVDDLATLNSVIRLMAQEKGAEQPLNKFARFKENINLWYEEMERHGLTEDEMKILEPICKLSYGICESQEGFMQLVQMPECGGFDLTWADKLRKAIAKKNPQAYEELQKEYFQKIKEKGLSEKLCNYVWNVLVATSRGYGFNKSHTLAYSLIALQEMNLAYKYPTIFWNCACLISDSSGSEKIEDDEDEFESSAEDNRDDIWNQATTLSVIDFGNDGEDDELNEDDENESDSSTDTNGAKTKSKKKSRNANYGKIASAIGKMKSNGISISPPDINKSTYTFSPNVEKSLIRFGLSGITKVGEDVIKSIIENRPYISIEDFLNKVKVKKPQMVNLIKCGAFDSFGDRVEVMKRYITLISEPKKRITLQNLKMLIDFGLIPDEYDLERRVYNFNKYLKKLKINDKYFGIDDIALKFYEQHFDMDLLKACDDVEGYNFKISITDWDNIYQHHMDIIRPYVKANNAELLEKVNQTLVDNLWDKYCKGSISKWEMDSVSCYFHEHELLYADLLSRDCDNFFEMSEEPEIDRIIPMKGKMVPLFKIKRIAGTVLDKNKQKKTVTLLTREGVVNVRIFGDVFTHYDRQISERGADGKKHVREASWFKRGSKIIVTGIRREADFSLKKYKNTPWHGIELIEDIDTETGELITRGERIEVN